MLVDDDGDGDFDRALGDTDRDGIMDTSEHAIGADLEHKTRPYIDFDGDGHGDRYQSFSSGYIQQFAHVDGYDRIDAVAADLDHDGRIDEMTVDEDHNGVVDHRLSDTDHDGWMNTRAAL
jgi:hypothetical protein